MNWDDERWPLKYLFNENAKFMWGLFIGSMKLDRYADLAENGAINCISQLMSKLTKSKNKR